MLKKIRLEPYPPADEAFVMSNGEDIEVLHWATVQQQLKDIGLQVKEVMATLNLLQRQDDAGKAALESLKYRVDRLEEKPKEHHEALKRRQDQMMLWIAGGGCLYMLVSAFLLITGLVLSYLLARGVL